MATLDPLSPGFWTTIGVAMLCGFMVGIERQLRGKPAGVRTSILICMGTAIFVKLGVVADAGGVDTTRVLGQIVTGVGFLGAGVMMSREGTIIGVTTAAVIWVLAAAGSAIGLGQHLGAIVISVLIVAVLTGVEMLERSVRRLSRGVHARNGDQR